ASATTPIVGFLNQDPVRDGLVASFNRPGGNVTGVITFQVPVAGKRLGLLHDLLPSATRIAVLANPTVGNPQLADLQAAARVLGLQIRVLNASTERDLDAAFATLAQSRPDVLFVTVSPFFFSRLDQITAATARL